MSEAEPLRARVLRPGDRVMLVSPAGPARPERVARGEALLSSWGLRVSRTPNATARKGYLAGTDDQRLSGVNAALRDPEVRGVVCTRGGYGAQRIADGLDIAAVRAEPKVLVGFSDVTALHLALWRGARLASVYGPGAAWLDERTPALSADSLRAALMTTEPVAVAADPDGDTAAVRVPGRAVGTLLGGNLCTLVSSIGTRDFPSLAGAILLLEEVAEAPYKVDRMLTQLRRTGLLAGLAGVAVGQFTDCADGWPVSIVDVLTERLGDLGVPVLGGLPVGHGYGQRSVPLGVPAVLDATAGTLTAAPAVAGQGPPEAQPGPT